MIDGVAKTPGVLSVVNGQAVATLTLDSLGKGVHVVTASYGREWDVRGEHFRSRPSRSRSSDRPSRRMAPS